MSRLLKLTLLWSPLLSVPSACVPSTGSETQGQMVPSTRYVESVVISEKPFERELPFVGIASPTRMVSLHFAVAGRLSSCPVKDGQTVKMGQVICQLGTAVIDVEIKRARTALEASRKVLASNFIDKQRRLYRQGVIGQVEFERARVEYESAVASERDARSLLELAQRKKAEHTLRAPWSGRVTGLSVSPGQLLTPDVKIGVLTASTTKDIHRIEIKLHASRFGSINLGDPAFLTSVAGKTLQSPAQGSVVNVGQSIDPVTQTFKIHADIELSKSSGVSLTEGMLVRGHIKNRVTEAGIVVPASSLVQWSSSSKAVVFIVNDTNRLEEREITATDYAKEEVLVTSGLSRGDRIVSRYAADLYQGLAVKTNTNPPAAKDTAPSEGEPTDSLEEEKP